MQRRSQPTFAEVVEPQKTAVRPPVFAGSFYPNSPEILSTQVRGLIDNAEPRFMDGELIGLISPHAGYHFSGRVAGHAYRQLAGKSFDSVILIGLSHRHPVQGAAIYGRGRFRTPLGEIEIDGELAGEILRRNRRVVHLPEAHVYEHSLEVQLPFLQGAITDFRIVPYLVQDDSPKNVITLGKAIAEAMRGRSALLICSTDICHYPSYDEAVQSDQVVIEAIQRFDADELRKQIADYLRTHAVSRLHCMMCSTGAVYATLEAGRRLGGTRIEVLEAANSGDVRDGRRDQVVSYMAAAIYC
ncbi:MAG: AmmeMemoRadiSam system protein B [Candidatus Poribacteria bacterium]|nr:AmmeMemoRadiSam system protein B [Candidatus Poribacteria bacterium]